jgi:hypothetical protein
MRSSLYKRWVTFRYLFLTCMYHKGIPNCHVPFDLLFKREDSVLDDVHVIVTASWGVRLTAWPFLSLHHACARLSRLLVGWSCILYLQSHRNVAGALQKVRSLYLLDLFVMPSLLKTWGCVFTIRNLLLCILLLEYSSLCSFKLR